MKRNVLNRIAKLLSAAVCLSAIAGGQDLSQPDRERGLNYLQETRDGVIEATGAVSEAQWKFKPGSDRWSIAEVVEHLALTEDYFLQNIRPELPKALAATPDRDEKQVDALIMTKNPDRSVKFQAPAPLVPTGRWTPTAALKRLLSNRRLTIEFLGSSPDLRRRMVMSPALGQPVDGYEWILTVAAHSARHTKQILEVKPIRATHGIDHEEKYAIHHADLYAGDGGTLAGGDANSQ
jgi:hypothetical protein